MKKKRRVILITTAGLLLIIAGLCSYYVDNNLSFYRSPMKAVKRAGFNEKTAEMPDVDNYCSQPLEAAGFL